MQETRKASVLLLAGDVRDAWKAALEAGLDARTTGWLDAVPFARLSPPDVAVISADLPRNAPQLLVNAFRGSERLRSIPLILAGLRLDEIEAASDVPPLLVFGPADRYLPAPVDPRALAAEAREIARTGRVPRKRARGQWSALGLAGVGIVALGGFVVARLLELAAEPHPGRRLVRAAEALFVVAVTCLVAGAAVAFATDRRPMTPHRRRRAFAWV